MDTPRPSKIHWLCLNPKPEIEPEEAIQAGATFAANGRNLLIMFVGFPLEFSRGVLNARSTQHHTSDVSRSSNRSLY